MNEFFQKHKARLETGDLRRFIKILIDDLEAVLNGYELVIRVMDAPEREQEFSEAVKAALAENRVVREADGRLHLPVYHQNDALAVITAKPAGGREIPEEVHGLLPRMIQISLDKILLYKINITDPNTGLNNEHYFRSYLQKRLEGPARRHDTAGRLKPLSLSEMDDHPGLTLLLAEIANYDKVTAEYGRLEALRALKTVGGWLKEAVGGAMCLARLERGRLGLVLPREDVTLCLKAADRALNRLSGGEDQGLPRLSMLFGLASFPLDMAEEWSQADGEGSMADDLAEALLAKAELALTTAINHPGRSVFRFQDVLEEGGQVVQALPYDRVVVNLGRLAGAREGQVFVLGEARPEAGDVGYKGEVVLFEVSEDFALGEVVNLRSSLGGAQPGDPLTLSKKSLDQSRGLEQAAETSLDPLLGIPDHKGFMAELLSRVTERVESQEAFCLVLMRVDDYDEYRTIMGRLESDRQFRALYELIRGGLSEGWFVGRFSSDSLCVYAPGLSPEDGLARAENWRNQAAKRLRQTASFGVAYYPCGPFSPLEIMANAQKALEHASFFGPASTALFDSVSLNISGDKRFEVGDQEGAIAEYLKALELNPQDLNVLNSLGVCYGYQRNVDLAMQTFSRVLELDPQNLMAHYNQGFVLAMSGRLNEALDSLRQAARIDARQFDVLFQLGKTALALDLIEEALENFKRAAALKDHRPIVYRYLGQTLLKAERPDEAMDAFKAAVRYDPEDAPSLSQLGVLYMERTTDTDVALSLLKQSAAQDPANVHFRQRLARALAKAGKPVSSEMEYRQVLDMGAKSREVFFELGEVIREQGRDDEAEHFYRAALDVDPEFRPAQTALRQIGV